MRPTLEKAPEPRRSDREKDLGGMSWPVLVFRGGNEALNERLTCPLPVITGTETRLEGLTASKQDQFWPRETEDLPSKFLVPANVVANPNWQDQGLIEN